MDSGLQTVKFGLPGVVSTDLRLNEPRFATLPNIMKARKKQLEVLAIDKVLGTAADAKPHLTTTAVREPPTRKAGVKLENSAALISILKAKGFLK